MLGHYGINHHAVARQTLVHDARRRWRHRDARLRTTRASALFPLGDQHEVPRRLHVQLLAGLVADHHARGAALRAVLLLGRAGQHPLAPRQLGRQLLPTGMRTLRRARGFARDFRQRLALGFGCDLGLTDAGF